MTPAFYNVMTRAMFTPFPKPKQDTPKDPT
jgi:hypothetical protein